MVVSTVLIGFSSLMGMYCTGISHNEQIAYSIIEMLFFPVSGVVLENRVLPYLSHPPNTLICQMYRRSLSANKTLLVRVMSFLVTVDTYPEYLEDGMGHLLCPTEGCLLYCETKMGSIIRHMPSGVVLQLGKPVSHNIVCPKFDILSISMYPYPLDPSMPPKLKINPLPPIQALVFIKTRTGEVTGATRFPNSHRSTPNTC